MKDKRTKAKWMCYERLKSDGPVRVCMLSKKYMPILSVLLWDSLFTSDFWYDETSSVFLYWDKGLETACIITQISYVVAQYSTTYNITTMKSLSSYDFTYYDIMISDYWC